MRSTIKRAYYTVGGSIMAGILFASTDANAQESSGTRFGDIANHINDSIARVPGLITGVSYLVAIILGVLGIMKIKDHVENPSQTPLKEGAIRLAAGGALFALPIIMEAMMNTLSGGDGNQTNQIKAAALNKVDFNVK